MSNTAQQIEIYRHFAENELKNHAQELNTRYQNRELASNDLKLQALSEHQQIFQKELEDKIEEIITEENQYLKPALNDMKERFIEKMRQKQQYT